ncbi:MAG: dihydroorotate dehydrogenase electron transfer subunit [Candidatus Eisenbacteria sp.]|nr:dihydroorotate dehydrogenase electron transfer subunit [Candidatus Eisenbacteria bacterium]
MPSPHPIPCRAEILRNEKVAPEVYWLELGLGGHFPPPYPGQFVLLRVLNAWEPFLLRPMSIFAFETSRRGSRMEVLYRVVGRGTRILASRCIGEPLDLIGPLGRGFQAGGGRPRILIGGGMGVAPLVFLASRPEPEDVLILGCRSTSEFPVDFVRERVRVPVRVCTEDGSCGVTGVAPEMAEALAAQCEWKVEVIAGGPPAMLAVVARLCEDRDVPCQVTLEARMACGTGSCLGCAIPTRPPGLYRRACTEGPVFEAREIRWEALP